MALPPTDLSTLASLCGSVWSATGGVGPLALAMFVAGATGGVTHCALMCGPLVLAQVAALPVPPCASARLAAGARIPYHFGRLTSYGVLGALAGGFGRGIVRAIGGSAAPVALLLAIAAAIAAWAAWSPRSLDRTGYLSAWIARTARPLLGPGQLNGIRLGLVLGLLPCGLVYAALSVAASSASPVTGAALMLAFGAGTVPGLVSIGTIGRAIGIRFDRRLASLPLAINAALLALLAWRAWMAA